MLKRQGTGEEVISLLIANILTCRWKELMQRKLMDRYTASHSYSAFRCLLAEVMKLTYS